MSGTQEETKNSSKEGREEKERVLRTKEAEAAKELDRIVDEGRLSGGVWTGRTKDYR